MKKLRKMAVVMFTGTAMLLVASPSYSWDFWSFFRYKARTYATHTQDRYCNDDDKPGTPVPEPTAALLFGAGMVVAGAASRRRARR